MNLEVSKPLHLKHLKTSIDRDHEGSCGTFFPPAELHICTEELRTIESPPCFLSSIPPASEFTKGASEVNRALLCNDSPREVQNGEVVLTFSLYAKSSSSLPRAQRMQDVDVLGTQTLQQLRDSFSCGGGRGKMTTEERPHNGSGHEYAYFLIEGDFYATDAIRAANSSDNVSENSSGPNGVWAVRDWLLNQRGDSRTNIPTREQQSSGEPSDGGTSAGMREGTSCGASSSAVVLNDSRGPRGANCNSKALKQKRATRRSAGRLGDRDTDDGATSASTSLTGISSSSATAFDDNTGTEGVGSVAALITANEIVCSSERLKRKDGSVRKKKSSKTVKRTFASAWVVAEGDDSDNDVVANKSNDAFAIPLTVASETASTTVGQRRESNRIASPTRMGVTADDSQNETARSRLARSRSLLEVHGMPPSSALRVLPLDVSVGSLVLRAGVRYLYRHGTDSSCDCEHFLYLTDMHMHCCGNINSSNSNSNSTASVNAFPMFQFQDLPLLGSYPRQTFSAKAIAKKCGVCLLWSARYVVQGDRLADKSPMLYCQ